MVFHMFAAATPPAEGAPRSVQGEARRRGRRHGTIATCWARSDTRAWPSKVWAILLGQQVPCRLVLDSLGLRLTHPPQTCLGTLGACGSKTMPWSRQSLTSGVATQPGEREGPGLSYSSPLATLSLRPLGHRCCRSAGPAA